VSVYLDASVVVALFIASDPFTERTSSYLASNIDDFIASDPFTERTSSYLASNIDDLIISDFAGAEFTSVVARGTGT
jgi:hypothetical protein